jgi:hypothetical protein
MDSRRKRAMLTLAARQPQSVHGPPSAVRFAATASGKPRAAMPCRPRPLGAAACRRIALQYRIRHLVAPNLGDKTRQSIIHARFLVSAQ